MKKYQIILTMLCMMPILTSCDTFEEYIGPEHPFIMLGFAIFMLIIGFLIFHLALHCAARIVGEIIFFFFPFRLHYDD